MVKRWSRGFCEVKSRLLPLALEKVVGLLTTHSVLCTLDGMTIARVGII